MEGVEELRDSGKRKLHKTQESPCTDGEQYLFEEELKEALALLVHALELRDKYIEVSLQGDSSRPKFSPPSGVQCLYSEETEMHFLEGDSVGIPDVEEFYEDFEFVSKILHNGPLKSFCFKRLENLELKFRMHKNNNASAEKREQKVHSSKDIYTVAKVDTHVHHSACMNSKHLLRFMKHKLRSDPDEVVYKERQEELTLKDVFSRLGKHEGNLCIDSLDTHAHIEAFHRFDRFNSKYNPYGLPMLREIFLKYDNHIKGKYLAELTRDVIAETEEREYVACELGISVYGKTKQEWKTLCRWWASNNLFSAQVKWIVQIPRLYGVLRRYGHVSSFSEFLGNVFAPLFGATQEQDADKEIVGFLGEVVGFDSVDDESVKDKKSLAELDPPVVWRSQDNPPYQYYLYHMYYNISVLNRLRTSRKMNRFVFRPHSGESGDIDHLVAAFLLSKSIAHGVKLRKTPVLQYLYYLAQVGISMSPLSNNSLFLEFRKNPFPLFFARGLNVCLSTDDPLQFHYTKEPLMEEYSIASQIWRLTSCDQCEMAKNSVLISNFPKEKKVEWVGLYERNGSPLHDPSKTNVPELRFRYRQEMLQNELLVIRQKRDGRS